MLGAEYTSLIPLAENFARLPMRDLELLKGVV